jgi:hypothetical protein
VFDPDGRGQPRMQMNGPAAITVQRGGEVVVVTDWDEALMRLYHPDGRLLRTVTSDPVVQARDPKLRAFFNRGRVAAYPNGDLYYMFHAATPARVRRYAADGSHVDMVVEGAAMGARLMEAQTRRREAEAAGEMFIANTLNAVAVDTATGHLWVAPAIPEVYVYARNGGKLATYHMRDAAGRTYGGQDIWLTSSGEGLFVSGGRVFSFALPSSGRTEKSAGN